MNSIQAGGSKFPISLAAENESTSRCDTALSILVGKERRSPSKPSNERIRGEQSTNGVRSVCGPGTKKKKCGGEAAELIPFASWAQSSVVLPSQIKDFGPCIFPKRSIVAVHERMPFLSKAKRSGSGAGRYFLSERK
ncbi:hypothetical protein M9H77_23649 [Catharanthus roseus]|uniref:Uncharacterized protein n=1 Tax=Catharanthus roseus TaxID=4058 RepID=A0ACC0AUN3_CATRO|nr:hypothetical protein M9H77_23649 [Catharanthus roseus]